MNGGRNYELTVVVSENETWLFAGTSEDPALPPATVVTTRQVRTISRKDFEKTRRILRDCTPGSASNADDGDETVRTAWRHAEWVDELSNPTVRSHDRIATGQNGPKVAKFLVG